MDPIPIEIVNEATLPSYRSSAALCGLFARRGRCELIPSTSRRVSEWSRHRFAKAGHPVPVWWEDDPIMPGRAVQLFRLADAYYLPASGAVILPDGQAMESSVYEARAMTPDWSLSRLPFMTRKFEGGPVTFDPPADVARLKRAIVTMPAGHQTYGHFVLDCLSGVAAAMGVKKLAGGPFVFPPLLPWQQRHLELLGVTSPLIAAQPVYRVSQLFFTNCMAANLDSPNVHFTTIRDIQLSKVSGSPPIDEGERIYLSRRNSLRSFLNEPELEARLAAQGFSIIQPEQYPVDQQIQIFHRAKVIVGPTGSAFANAIYCQPETLVVEIVPTRMQGRWVGWLCALTGSRWRPYYCEGHSERSFAPQLDLRYGTDTDQLVRYILTEIGE